jgi:hypothetical protein
MSRHDWGTDYAVPIRRAAGSRDRVNVGGRFLLGVVIGVGIIAALRSAGIL